MPRKAAAPTASTAGAGNAWSYEGAAGPSAWASLRPEYALCAQGQRQSPIDLRGGLPVELEPLRFGYQASRFGVLDTGRTLQVNVAAGNHVELGGRRYELKRIQFHRPAEHRVDGRSFEMGAHLMHEDAQGRELVVAVLFDPGPALPAVQTLWGHVPLEPHEEVAARVSIDPAQLLPVDRRYFTYMGSLTTPPCREGVQWAVLRTPVTLSAEQIEVFARLYPLNARPLQAAGGRRILQSE
jgi:carbonic anhydrase